MKNQNKKYKVQDREAGNLIEVFNSKKEAEKALSEYEESDKKNNIFENDFYQIVKIEE